MIIKKCDICEAKENINAKPPLFVRPIVEFFEQRILVRYKDYDIIRILQSRYPFELPIGEICTNCQEKIETQLHEYYEKEAKRAFPLLFNDCDKELPFVIQTLVVKDEIDFKQIAEELYKLYVSRKRGVAI